MKSADTGNVARRRSDHDRDEALAPAEAVSALADGELHGEAALAAALQSLSNDAGLRSSWHEWHLVGEVLRSREVTASGADPAFAARVMARLASERAPRPAAPVTAPVAIKQEATNAVVASATIRKTRQDAANSPVFRWKLVAGFATLVALGSVGWNLLEAARPPAGSAATLVQAQPPQLIRDPQLDELLAAHEQSGAVSALQMPAGFLRNATFGGRSR